MNFVLPTLKTRERSNSAINKLLYLCPKGYDLCSNRNLSHKPTPINGIAEEINFVLPKIRSF